MKVTEKVSFLLLLTWGAHTYQQGFYRARPSILLKSLSMMSSDSSDSTEALTHLQLRDIDDQSSPDVSGLTHYASENNTSRAGFLKVHEFVKLDGEILCACTSSRSTLEHLALYLDHTNYSISSPDNTVFYRKSAYICNDKLAYNKLLALFQAGRMLISSSSYDEMWTEAGEDSTKAQQAGGKKKTTLDKLLKSNVKRYLVRKYIACIYVFLF